MGSELTHDVISKLGVPPKAEPLAKLCKECLLETAKIYSIV